MKTLALLIAAILAILILTGPSEIRFLGSEEQIEASFLEDIPLGTSMDDARAYLVGRSYQIREESLERGILMRDSSSLGTARIRVGLDTYWLTGIYAMLAFDSDLRLVGLRVHKSVDSV